MIKTQTQQHQTKTRTPDDQAKQTISRNHKTPFRPSIFMYVCYMLHSGHVSHRIKGVNEYEYWGEGGNDGVTKEK